MKGIITDCPLAPIEKFISLLEDIVEAEDSLPPDAILGDLPPEWFSPLTFDCSQPLLQPHIIRKVINHIGKVARPMKRGRLASRTNDGGIKTPRSGRVSEVDTSILTRILRILERSVKAGEDIQAFEARSSSSSSVGLNPNKDSRKLKLADSLDHRERLSTSRPPSSGRDDPSVPTEMVDPTPDSLDINGQLTAVDLDKLTTSLNVARNSVLAADCCIALLGSDRLTKQVSGTYSIYPIIS